MAERRPGADGTSRRNPYVGLRPFATGERLYGRDVELADLRSLLSAETIVMLHSRNGAGKTSLIQAGLIPALQYDGFEVLPVIRVGLDPPLDARQNDSQANRFIRSTLLSLAGSASAEDDATALTELNLPEYLDRRWGSESSVNQVLIFDQLEEILTPDPTDETAKHEFFAQLEAGMRPGRRLLLSVREEYLAPLLDLARELPVPERARVRLRFLSPPAAALAVQGPAQEVGIPFSDAAITMLVQDLSRVRVQQADGSVVEQLGQEIEPFLLQLVCLRLWQRLGPNVTQITEVDVAAAPTSAEAALADYYAETVQAASVAVEVSERAIRDWIESRLVTPQGTRAQVLLGPGTSQGLDNRIVEWLVNARLVRVEARSGATWFELAHDRQIEPIRSNNAMWRQRFVNPWQQQAQMWAREQRPDALLLRGEQLSKAEDWAGQNPSEMTDFDREFLDDSRRRAERQQFSADFDKVMAQIAAIAQQQPPDVEPLLELLAAHAPRGALRRLVVRMQERERVEIRREIATALGGIGDSRAIEALIGLTRDPGNGPRLAAVQALGRVGDEREVAALRASQKDADAGVRAAATTALEQLERRQAEATSVVRADRLSAGAQQALLFADGLRQALGTREVYTEDVLAGLYQHAGGTARTLLTLFDDDEGVAAALEQLVSRTASSSVRLAEIRPSGLDALRTLHPSANSAQALAEAARLAGTHGNGLIRARHLLAGLLAVPDAVAARWIADSLQVPRETLHQLIVDTPDIAPPLDAIRRASPRSIAQPLADAPSPPQDVGSPSPEPVDAPALGYPELEIRLRTTTTGTLQVELRSRQPANGDANGVEPVQTAAVRLDLESLRELPLDSDRYGQALANSLFGDPSLRAAFARATTNAGQVRVQLDFSPEAPQLHGVRWELLRDPMDERPLVLREDVIFSRHITAPEWRPVQLRPANQLTALVVIANPRDVDPSELASLDVELELQLARQSLADIRLSALASGGQATLSHILEELLKGPDILYLVCHVGTGQSEMSVWLEDDSGNGVVVAGNRLADLLRDIADPPRLVVLADGQTAGTPTARASDNDALVALGAYLTSAGIPAVLAMQPNLSLKTSTRFMAVFFRELGLDGQVDRAAAVARSAVRERPDWWAPVLFTRLRSGRIWSGRRADEDRPEFERWPALIASIRDGRCVPIVGAGVAESLFGSRRDLARRLAETHRYPMVPGEPNDLMRVAQYVAVIQSDPGFPHKELADYLKEEITLRYGADLPLDMRDAPLERVMRVVGARARQQDPAELHRVLATLPLPMYITTAQDNLLAEALVEAGKQPEVELCRWRHDGEWPASVFEHEPEYRPSPERPLVYHLLGQIRILDSVVVTEEEYDQLRSGLERELLPRVVRRGSYELDAPAPRLQCRGTGPPGHRARPPERTFRPTPRARSRDSDAGARRGQHSGPQRRPAVPGEVLRRR